MFVLLSQLFLRPHQFYGLFSREVLHIEFYHAYSTRGFSNLMLQGLLVVREIAVAQQAQGAHLLCLITDDAYTPEGDDAAEVGRIFLRMDLIAVDDAE